MLSEILSVLFGRHKEFLLDDLRRRGAFGLVDEFEVVDDLVWGQALPLGREIFLPLNHQDIRIIRPDPRQ